MPQLSPQEEARYASLIRQDPAIAAILNDPKYSTPMLRDAAVNNYLKNNPAGALYTITPRQSPERGAGAYHYDPAADSLDYETYGPQHWYTDPGSKGMQALAMLGIGAGAGAIPGLPGFQGGSYVGNAVNSVENSITGGASAAGAGGAAGAAGASGLANGSGLLKDILTKYAPLGLAGLSAAQGFKQPAANQDLEDVIGMAKNRVQQSEPLFQALNKMASAGLPNYAK